jgi:hypothetical protein
VSFPVDGVSLMTLGSSEMTAALLTELRFLGPRARPFVRCVNCFGSSFVSVGRLGSGAEALFTGNGRGDIIEGPLLNTDARPGLKRFTIDSVINYY